MGYRLPHHRAVPDLPYLTCQLHKATSTPGDRLRGATRRRALHGIRGVASHRRAGRRGAALHQAVHRVRRLVVHQAADGRASLRPAAASCVRWSARWAPSTNESVGSLGHRPKSTRRQHMDTMRWKGRLLPGQKPSPKTTLLIHRSRPILFPWTADSRFSRSLAWPTPGGGCMGCKLNCTARMCLFRPERNASARGMRLHDGAATSESS